MNDEHRPIEIVDLGSGRPAPTPSPRERNTVLLSVIAVCVAIAAAGSVYTGWTVHQSREDNRLLTCLYNVGFGFGDPEDDAQTYDDLTAQQKEVVDRLDCDIPGR